MNEERERENSLLLQIVHDLVTSFVYVDTYMSFHL